MEVVLDAVLVGLLAVGLGAAAIRVAARQRRQLHALMSSVAASRGGVTSDPGWFPEPTLHLIREGLQLRVEMDVGRADRGLTRWRARLTAPGTVRFTLSGSTLDAHDPACARRVVTSGMMMSLLNDLRGGRIASTGREVVLVWHDLPTSAEQIERGIDLLVEIAAADPFGLDALRSLPGAAYRASETALPHVELEGPGDVTIGPIWQDGRVLTRARAHAGSEGEGITIDPRFTSAALRLGGELCRSDRELAITWPGIETDPQRLEGAVELLRGLGSPPSMGVFR